MERRRRHPDHRSGRQPDHHDRRPRPRFAADSGQAGVEVSEAHRFDPYREPRARRTELAERAAGDAVFQREKRGGRPVAGGVRLQRQHLRPEVCAPLSDPGGGGLSGLYAEQLRQVRAGGVLRNPGGSRHRSGGAGQGRRPARRRGRSRPLVARRRRPRRQPAPRNGVAERVVAVFPCGRSENSGEREWLGLVQGSRHLAGAHRLAGGGKFPENPPLAACSPLRSRPAQHRVVSPQPPHTRHVEGTPDRAGNHDAPDLRAGVRRRQTRRRILLSGRQARPDRDGRTNWRCGFRRFPTRVRNRFSWRRGG